MKSSIVMAPLAALICGLAFAHDRCCEHCGCQHNVKKVCRVVCEMKEEKEICYDCKCEDFCIPGPSCKCGEKCECSCAARHGYIRRNIWEPSDCATVHTRHLLLRREVVKKVPTYKWVVEYVCCDCEGAGACAQQPLPPEAEQLAGPKPDLSDEQAAQPARQAIVPSGYRSLPVVGKLFGYGSEGTSPR